VRALREAEAVALRSRDAIKQLDSALAAAQVLQEREAQVRRREEERERRRAEEKADAALVVGRDEDERMRERQKAVERENAKIHLRHHLQRQ